MSRFKKVILLFIMILFTGVILTYTNIQNTFNKTNNNSITSTSYTTLIDKVSEV